MKSFKEWCCVLTIAGFSKDADGFLLLSKDGCDVGFRCACIGLLYCTAGTSDFDALMSVKKMYRTVDLVKSFDQKTVFTGTRQQVLDLELRLIKTISRKLFPHCRFSDERKKTFS